MDRSESSLSMAGLVLSDDELELRGGDGRGRSDRV
jgi:hypothetical protein